MLTGKQEKFVRNLIQGMTQRQAYKNSYDAENMSDEAIDVEACRLFNEPKISLRYQELLDRVNKACILDAQSRLEYLSEIIMGIEQEHGISADGEEFERPATLKERMQAIDIMNKMQGEYTTKIEGNVMVKLEDLL